MCNLTLPAAPLRPSTFGPAGLRTGDSKSPESTPIQRLSVSVHRHPLPLPIPYSRFPGPGPLALRSPSAASAKHGRLFVFPTLRPLDSEFTLSVAKGLFAVSLRETQTISA